MRSRWPGRESPGQHVILFTREQLEKKSQPVLRDCGLNLQAALGFTNVMPRHAHTLIEFVLEMQEEALKKKDRPPQRPPPHEPHPDKLYLWWREDMKQCGTYEKVVGHLHNGFPVWRHAHNDRYGQKFPFVMYIGREGRWRICDEELNPDLPEFSTPIDEVSNGKVMMKQPIPKKLWSALAAEVTMRDDDDPVSPADVKYWVTTRGRGLNENPLDRRAGFDWVSNAAVKVMREFKKPFGGTNFYTQAINQRS